MLTKTNVVGIVKKVETVNIKNVDAQKKKGCNKIVTRE